MAVRDPIATNGDAGSTIENGGAADMRGPGFGPIYGRKCGPLFQEQNGPPAGPEKTR